MQKVTCILTEVENMNAFDEGKKEPESRDDYMRQKEEMQKEYVYHKEISAQIFYQYME